MTGMRLLRLFCTFMVTWLFLAGGGSSLLGKPVPWPGLGARRAAAAPFLGEPGWSSAGKRLHPARGWGCAGAPGPWAGRRPRSERALPGRRRRHRPPQRGAVCAPPAALRL